MVVGTEAIKNPHYNAGVIAETEPIPPAWVRGWGWGLKPPVLKSMHRLFHKPITRNEVGSSDSFFKVMLSE
ncbi:hypothetical protein CEXT_595931 [Caerostris extrusa]|uniref:Uncharacterized protein n=1 Tax=Caerostris extrusa TaxID=172846 RepID=A0AAV4Y2K5_CAEEX|nr:hypothetical protein CEXT_595931 [Caerostris extrusa]